MLHLVVSDTQNWWNFEIWHIFGRCYGRFGRSKSQENYGFLDFFLHLFGKFLSKHLLSEKFQSNMNYLSNSTSFMNNSSFYFELQVIWDYFLKFGENFRKSDRLRKIRCLLELFWQHLFWVCAFSELLCNSWLLSPSPTHLSPLFISTHTSSFNSWGFGVFWCWLLCSQLAVPATAGSYACP